MRTPKSKASLRSGILVPVVSGLVVLATLLTTVIVSLAMEDLRSTYVGRIAQAGLVLQADWEGRQKTLAAVLPWFERSGRAIQLLAADDHAGAIEFGKTAMASFGTDYFVLVRPDGSVLARAHDPTNYNDSIAGQVTIQAAMKGQTSVALEPGKVVKLSLRGAVPVWNAKNELVGMVSTGYTLSQDAYVDRIAQLLGAEVTIFEGNTRLVTTVRSPEGERIVGTTLNQPAIEAQVLGRGEPYYGVATIQGVAYSAVYLPVFGPEKKPMGMIFAGLSLAGLEATTQGLLITSVGLSAAVVLLTALVLAWFLGRKVIRPLVETATDLQSMGVGLLPLVAPGRLARRDEIGDMSRSLAALTEYFRAGQEVATQMAAGNLDVRPQLAGPEDQFGQAFATMADGLNDLVRRVVLVTDEVVEGVDQIANGTQSLSSSATEAAASLTAMGANLKELVTSSQTNSRESQEASAFAKQVGAGAATGQAEMEGLLTAMDAIAASALEIQSIVQVIDDIAFQVNLLALNANVEAARAGKYGRGFGVVAEEVRNLATRSSTAAKETSRMVDEARRRIELGATKARKTGEHLSTIVGAVARVAETLEAVARRSGNQNEGLDALNRGMEQLEQVTQANASAAEETSAAGTQIQGTVQMLRAVAGTFQVREG